MYTIDQNVDELESIVRNLEAGNWARSQELATAALYEAREQQRKYWEHLEERNRRYQADREHAAAEEASRILRKVEAA